MPTVWRALGFDSMIYTDDHEPMHVHCWKGGKVVLINLGDSSTAPSLRKNKGMSFAEVRWTTKIVTDNQEYLIEKWGLIHGTSK